VRIQHDLTVPGNPEIFALGDTASLDQDGKPLGGVAQVAMQQGRYAARIIHRRVTGGPALPPFRYFDRGIMAVVGQGYAVLQAGRIHLKGRLAWIPWMLVHIAFLARPGLRVSVVLQWAWTFLTGQRGSRLIVSGAEPARAADAPQRSVTARSA
jgi:NADH dehydrogenase FAD-containing subunit